MGFAHDNTQASGESLTPPEPPILELVNSSQSLYKIVPEQSEARYNVKEKFIGIEGTVIVGSTQGLSGQILIDRENPEKSQVGEIIVNVEQLGSDSKQRDNRLRNAYLESTKFPEVSFIANHKTSFPETIQSGDEIKFELRGFLTVRDFTAYTDWNVNMAVEEDVIRGTATTITSMSTFGVGPINVIGLLSTEDELILEFDFVAVREDVDMSFGNNSTIQTRAEDASLDFFTDIQPIMEAKCVGCHMKGEIGHSVYAMDTANDVIEIADDIALMTRVGYMPPWMPGDQAPAFKHDRSLSDEQVKTILGWVDMGAPAEGDLSTPLANTSSQQNIREDIVLEMPVAYQPTGEQLDDYRCFLIDPNLPEGGWLTGSVVKPGDRRVVHHVIIYLVSENAREEAEQKSLEDGRPGWECFGGPQLSTDDGFGQQLGGWVPGNGPLILDESQALEFFPDSLLVVEMHYNYEAGFYPDQTSLAFEMAEPDDELIALQGFQIFGAVELPCPADSDSEACDRDFALNNFHLKEDRAFANDLLSICSKRVRDFADQPADNVVSTCDWRAAIDGEIVMVGGHMHELGKSLRVELNPDSENPVILQDLPNWDFNWQDSYILEKPIPVKKGDILRITCTWDNTRGVTEGKREARYVTWGEGTSSEMCMHSYMVKPSSEYEGVYVDFVDTLNIPQWLKWFYRE